jgi:coenzyme F420-dependent glucose-6-phosphate dehydrogenase
MIELGYSLSSEEFGPRELVDFAERAERAGFSFALISDHFHPWTDKQGQSPFVWAVIGGIARVTRQLRLGTGVTCPINRIHPAIIAQAAATAAAMMPGRFFLGVGTGENLNEHINGRHWSEPSIRLEMLREAIEIIRRLWKGAFASFYGRYFVVENARIYTLPEQPICLHVAASNPQAAELAAEVGDGLICTAPDADLVKKFQSVWGRRPCYGQFAVCVDADEQTARSTALERWPNAAIPGDLKWELPLPEHFEQAAKLVDEDMVAERVVCGADPKKHLDKISAFVDAGFDHVYIHQIGPDQEAFFRFYETEILPEFRRSRGER